METVWGMPGMLMTWVLQPIQAWRLMCVWIVCLDSFGRKYLLLQEDYGTDEMVSRVEQAMNSLLEDGFTLQGFKDWSICICKHCAVGQACGKQEPN